MLDVLARDGAARLTKAPLGEQTLETPGVLWLHEDLPPGAQWQPRISTRPDAPVAVLATTRFSEPPPATSQRLLLRRTLAATASMQGERVRFEDLGQDVAVWGDAVDLAKDPKHFVPALARARSSAGFQRALYAPGLAHPHTLALYAYAGIDLFDSVAALHAAANGRFLTDTGAYEASLLKDAQCTCPACHLESPESLTRQELAAHNQYALKAEAGAVRNAIRDARLRELVEARCRAHPELVGLLRRFDQSYDHFERFAPVERKAKVWATTKESLQRPDCRRFRQRVMERYRPPTAAPVLLLLPCSHRKPYSTSRTHRAFTDAIWAAGAAGLVHEVILTSPLGLVPRELELTYPAAHYDVPVTGDWDEEEANMIRTLLANHLTKRPYARVISHLPRHTYEIAKPLLPADTIVSCDGENATAAEAVRRLELVLGQLGKEHRRANLQTLHWERLRSIADYQFGPTAADKLFAHTHSSGKWPTGKLFDHAGEQLAMLPTERGLLSLTNAGGQRLLDAGVHRVAIADFAVRGSVFAVGVEEADPAIRPGDEVVLHHGGKIKGVGVAKMTGTEMVQLKRGEAVVVRHHA